METNFETVEYFYVSGNLLGHCGSLNKKINNVWSTRVVDVAERKKKRNSGNFVPKTTRSIRAEAGGLSEPAGETNVYNINFVPKARRL